LTQGREDATAQRGIGPLPSSLPSRSLFPWQNVKEQAHERRTMSILPRFDGTAIKNFIFPSGWGFPDSLRLPLSLCELRRTGPPKRAGFGGASSAGVEQEITEITERKPADLEGRNLQGVDFQHVPFHCAAQKAACRFRRLVYSRCHRPFLSVIG